MKEQKIALRDIILGGQDGLVNVLGLSLGLFAAGGSIRVIVVAGLAATFSEAVSMGAVAYTSASADKEKITADQNTLIFNAIVVGLSALAFGLLPLTPFGFFSIATGMWGAVIISALVLFCFGAFKARSVGGTVWKSGIQILFIGLLSALAGFGIGLLLKV